MSCKSPVFSRSSSLLSALTASWEDEMISSSRRNFKHRLPIHSAVIRYERVLREKICTNRQIDPHPEDDRWVMQDAVIQRYRGKMRRWEAEFLPVSEGLYGECCWLLRRQDAKKKQWSGTGKENSVIEGRGIRDRKQNRMSWDWSMGHVRKERSKLRSIDWKRLKRAGNRIWDVF